MTTNHTYYQDHSSADRFGDDTTYRDHTQPSGYIDNPYDPTLPTEKVQSSLTRDPSQKSHAPSTFTTGTRPLTYIDEDFNYYPGKPGKVSEEPSPPLVHDAAAARGSTFQDLGTPMSM